MAITIKEMQVHASVIREGKEVSLSPEIIRKIKEDVLREIREEMSNSYPSRKER